MKRKPPIRNSGSGNPRDVPDQEALKAYHDSLSLYHIDSILSKLWDSLRRELTTADTKASRQIRAARLCDADPLGFLNLMQRAREECEQIRITPKSYNRTLRLAKDCYLELLNCNARTIEELNDNYCPLFRRAMDPVIEYKLSLLARYKNKLAKRKTSDSAGRHHPGASAGTAAADNDHKTDRSTRRTCVTAYTHGVPVAKIRMVDNIINDQTKRANEKLMEWDELFPIPVTATAKALGETLGVSAQGIARTINRHLFSFAC